MKPRNKNPLYAICINNESNPASLQLRKLYKVIPDVDAAAYQQLRVVDEDEEDYLYPADCFIVVELNHKVVAALEETYALG